MTKRIIIGGETYEITDRNEKEYEAFIAACEADLKVVLGVK